MQYRDWEFIDLDMIKFGTAACRAIGKFEPEFLTEKEIGFIGKLLNKNVQQLKMSAVHLLNSIFIDERYKKLYREQAVDLIKEVLMQENDVSVRAEAIKCFEKGRIVSLNNTTRNIASWWERKKEEAKQKTIVISDDEAKICEWYQVIFKKKGIEHVYSEWDGLRTIQLVEQVKPALIITDYTKPKINGLEMARKIKTKPEFAETPIILCSATCTEEILNSDIFCSSAEKPFNSDDLILKVQTALAGKYEE